MPAARQANKLEAACVHFRDAQGNFAGFFGRADKDKLIPRCLLQANKWSAVAAGLCADCRWKPMIETIVQRLVVLPECGHVLSHLRRTLLLNDDASNEIGNLFHFRFTHAQPGYFYRPHAQASWLIPIFDSVSRNELLVGDNIGLSQSLRHRQPSAK